ncbi:hypothetical protein [Homoserinibacter sp. YIM 151385]|uniref:hypothetical protein n=1 Tax=Homoserinibacter sp. YIM 151385 TaxID=2985506 RepID=UPI0022F01FE0|nr:hypothetical protein [Homoserinibacter sp. YIM 151385]WBU39077.1 hypothetical protein OF852_05740 [Homoserinibacter sp. YIM 151385]
MGFFDRLFGTEERAPEAAPVPQRQQAVRTASDEDERAIERYRYLIRTAPPETIEQVHAEAFAKLSDEQRAVIYEELSRGAGTGERPLSSEPATLARAATRAEMRQPGTMERVVGGEQAQGAGMGQRPGMGFGGMVAGSLLGTVAGYVIGSALVSAFLPWDDGGASADGGEQGADAGGSDAGGADAAGADAGGFDFGGGDFGGDFGF